MATSYIIISNKKESGKYTVSANKARIETHVAATSYCNCPVRIIKNTAT